MATRPARLPANLKLTRDGVGELQEQMLQLIGTEVLVGFPEESTDRDPEPDEPAGMTNAALGYIHDNGQPERNIPARPFMLPAMAEVQDQVTDKLTRMARKVVTRRSTAADLAREFEQLGSLVELAIKRKINEGIPPPLSKRTLLARANRRGKSKGRQGALWELAWRAAGVEPGTELAKPLVDTAQMRNAVKYVVRLRRRNGRP